MPPRYGLATSPVTGVSAEEARDFAVWLSEQDRYDYRLPTLEDILALADRAHDGWQVPAGGIRLQRNVGTDDLRFMSEWLQCVPKHPNSGSGLRCIANPAWRAGIRGAVSDGRYSFVTFRLVRVSRRQGK